MKRLLTLSLALALLVSAFAGCTGADSSTTPASTASTGGASTVPQEPMEITWVPRNQIGVTGIMDTEVQKLVEEKFNVKLTIPSVDINTAEQWNLYWATGNTPDVSEMNNTSQAVFKLASQGLVRDIPEGWLDEYMPDWMASVYELAAKESVYQQITSGGKQYVIPYASEQYPYIMAIRKDWMDNLGIKDLPTTPDELFEILKRFTYDDPDGNGQNDTYGIHGGSQKGYMRFGYVHTYYNIWPDVYYNIDGKIVYTSMTDTYLESLKYLNTWFKAGVVDPEFATEDRVVQRKKWAEGKFGVLVDNPWWFSLTTTGNLTTMANELNPDAEVVFLEPFKDKNGKQTAQAWWPTVAEDGSSFFGINCTDEKMQKIMEIKNSFVKDFDWYVRCNYGEKGVDYDYNDEGVITPKEEALTAEYLTEKGLGYFTMRPKSYAFLKENKMITSEDVKVYDFSRQFEPMYLYVNFNSDGVNEANSQYAADIKTISDEFYYNAIMGKYPDLDAEFVKFKERLVAAGVQKVIDEYQQTLIQ